MTTTAFAALPAPPVDLSSEAASGPWEIVVPAAIAAAALLYLARSYGFLSKRKTPGCAQCPSGCGCGGENAATAEARVGDASCSSRRGLI
jgi:hypothetical protein